MGSETTSQLKKHTSGSRSDAKVGALANLIKNARKSTKGRIGIPSESSGVGITSNLNRVTRHTDASKKQKHDPGPETATRQEEGEAWPRGAIVATAVGVI